MARHTIILFCFFCCTFSFSANSQSFWRDVSPSQLQLPDRAEVQLPLAKYRTLELNYASLKKALSSIPPEAREPLPESPYLLDLPLPEGGMATFRLVGTHAMAPSLAERYPHIRTYRGISTTDPGRRVRLGYGTNGFYANFMAEEGEVFIERYASHQTKYYVSYYRKDVLPKATSPLACGYDPESMEELLDEWSEGEAPVQQGHARSGAPIELRTYRFAIINTGEFAESKGFTTVDEVMSAFVEIVNVLNGLLESTIAIRVEMIPANEALIYLDSDTDPFSTGNVGGSLLGQAAPAIEQSQIPSSAYDIAHVFTGPCQDVGGVVSGAACGIGKARGVTCFFSSNILATARGTLAHEVGHQLSASHSWSNCPGNLGQLASAWAFEPGSGITIMSYSNACGNQNLSGADLDMYNLGSIVQMTDFTRNSLGSTCGTLTATSNIAPEVSLPYTDDFFIPISTPFELTAQATDANGDELTYSWEQYNLGPIAPLGDPIGDGPSFRVFAPKTSPSRMFPRPEVLTVNSFSREEVLPTYNRNLTFRCAVRDNHPEGGGTAWEEVSFEATESAGPFRVESPNTGDVVWKQGEYREVTWDVANTDNQLVNCQLVSIRLSLDGGFTYPHTLVARTPNDGSAFVPVPKVLSDKARVRVEASDNIFFDLSNQNFRIEAAEAPTYTVELDPAYRRTCLPDAAEVLVRTDSIQGFADTISLDISSPLPGGVTASFDKTQLLPSDSATLSLDFGGVTQTQEFEVVIRAVAANADTAFRTVAFRLVSNDFSDLALEQPVDGQSGIVLSTDFDWSDSGNAERYNFELATNPAFGPHVIESAEHLIDSDYQLNTLLEENTLYYWRVQPVNECGGGAWSLPNGFHTNNAVCSPVSPSDTPISISGTGTPTVESSIFVPTSGTLNDVNIPRIKGNYQPVNSLRLSLVSPSGTSVVLFDENCGNTVNLNTGFDDDAPSAILCPPDDGIVVQPVEPLAALAGEPLQGQWKLRLQVATLGFGGGGGLDDWQLEFCANVTPQNPALVRNDTLFTPPAAVNSILSSQLRTEDEDNAADEITYTLVAVPRHGILRDRNRELKVGDTFTQTTIDIGALLYQHNGDDNALDQFVFTIQDGTGGWLPKQFFNIKMDEDATVSTAEATAAPLAVRLFPNPAMDEINLLLEGAPSGRTEVRLFNLQGQLLQDQPFAGAQQLITLSTAQLPAGLYVVHIRQGERMVAKRVSIQR